jgi:hypothetical protein
MDVIRIHVHDRRPARGNASDCRVLIFSRLFTGLLDFRDINDDRGGATQWYFSAFFYEIPLEKMTFIVVFRWLFWDLMA